MIDRGLGHEMFPINIVNVAKLSRQNDSILIKFKHDREETVIYY